MPPKSDTAVVKKAVATAFQQARSKPVRFDFLEPGAADPANENSAEASTEVAPDQADPNTTDPDEDEDTTSSEADLGELFQRARKRPMNTAWLIGKEGLVLRADLRKPIDVMHRQAMAAGA
jgi:hypothetical protein